MQIIKFDSNSNNKLSGTYFTAVLLHDEQKHVTNTSVIIMLGEKRLGTATIMGRRKIMIDDINDYIAGLDSNQTTASMRTSLRYKYSGVNWATQALSFLLLKMDKTKNT